MDKQEILERSRRENGIADEREKQQETYAASMGMWFMFVFAVVFGQLKSFLFGQPWTDVMAVAFFGASVTQFFMYRSSRYRGHLAGCIIFALGMVIFLVSYVLHMNGIVF